MATEAQARALLRAVAFLVVSVTVTACEPANKATSSAVPKAVPTVSDSATAVPKELDSHGFPMRYSVVPYGYNYTDNYISSFEVNGAGGGNLEVSDWEGGGGGSVCCMTLVSGLPLGHEFLVKWTRDRKRWCEQTVKLTKPIPFDPRYFEVHFYPDGHIEVEATQQATAPRTGLERFSRGQRHETGNINNDEKYSRCKDGY